MHSRKFWRLLAAVLLMTPAPSCCSSASSRDTSSHRTGVPHCLCICAATSFIVRASGPVMSSSLTPACLPPPSAEMVVRQPAIPRSSSSHTCSRTKHYISRGHTHIQHPLRPESTASRERTHVCRARQPPLRNLCGLKALALKPSLTREQERGSDLSDVSHINLVHRVSQARQHSWSR